MMGPADRAAAAAGVDGPHEWSPVTVELCSSPGVGLVVAVLDGAGVEVGRAAITPSMVQELTGPEFARVMVRLIRRAVAE